MTVLIFTTLVVNPSPSSAHASSMSYKCALWWCATTSPAESIIVCALNSDRPTARTYPTTTTHRARVAKARAHVTHSPSRSPAPVSLSASARSAVSAYSCAKHSAHSTKATSPPPPSTSSNVRSTMADTRARFSCLVRAPGSFCTTHATSAVRRRIFEDAANRLAAARHFRDAIPRRIASLARAWRPLTVE